MAICKKCNATIPDGTEICSSCLDKEKIKSNESYLDSLLNSVKNSAPDAEEIYKKKNTNGRADSDEKKEDISHSSADVKEEDSQDEDFYDYTVDMKDFEDFFDNDDESNSLANDDDLAGADELSYSDKLSGESNDDLTNKTGLSAGEKASYDAKLSDNELPADDGLTNDEEVLDNVSILSDEKTRDDLSIPDDEARDDVNFPDDLSLAEDEQSDDFYYGEGSLDYMKLLGEEQPEHEEKSNDLSDADSDKDLANMEEEDTEDDEILSLLNIISSDDPVSQDAKAISDILSGKAEDKIDTADTPTVGEVFSDALKVVTSLNDSDLDDIDLPDQLSDATEEADIRKQKKEKTKASKKESKADKKKDKKSRQQPEGDTDQAASDAKKKSKKGLIQRLFGNVSDEKAAVKKAAKEQTANQEAAAAKEKPKKGLLSKLSKDKKAASDNEDDKESADAKKPKAEAEAKKAEKKEKKKKKKEIIEVIDEIEEDEGRINRIGAGIVFIFFGLIVMLLLVGTNMVSYSLSIQHAKDYFEKQKYNEAYNEVYGIDFKAEDMVIYDKIMTVMLVNKQLNSYNNYYYLGKYPEALDSLLKGLERYDKYIEFATMLGVKTDLDYVREQILAELKTVFKISEKEAMKIMAQDDKEAYSQEVYKIVLENMNN